MYIESHLERSPAESRPAKSAGDKALGNHEGRIAAVFPHPLTPFESEGMPEAGASIGLKDATRQGELLWKRGVA